MDVPALGWVGDVTGVEEEAQHARLVQAARKGALPPPAHQATLTSPYPHLRPPDSSSTSIVRSASTYLQSTL